MVARSITIRQFLRAVFVLGLLGGAPAVAQPPVFPLPRSAGPGVGPIERPGEERPGLPAFPTEAPPPLDLPPLKPPPDQHRRLSEGLRVFVRAIRLTGNTLFSDEELSQVTAPYVGRWITSEELLELRHRLTLYYVDRGYINSGAVIPDQQVTEGQIAIRIVEGRLTAIDVSGTQRLHTDYVSRRIALDAGPPMNIKRLQERLVILQQSPLIGQLNAELVPGRRSWESVLKVKVQEATPYQVFLSANNHRAPSVGAEQIEAFAVHRNLSGRGDAIGVRYGLTQGLDDVSAFYEWPLNARDATLAVQAGRSDSSVVEEPFEDLDIKSDSESFGVSLRYPVHRTVQQTFTLGLAVERRHSETFLDGRPFSFSPGVNDGESTVTVVRFSQEWLDRSLRQVIAARSMFSLGVDAFGATVNSSAPDGQFLAWLGQFQWARRLEGNNVQLLARADLQLASDSLLPLEKFAVGGAHTVRGYRENQLVRDNGLVASVELRIPVIREEAGRTLVYLAPFLDLGRSWNTDLATPKPKRIASAGLGVRWDPSPKLHAELYAAKAFKEIDNPNHDLQDSGIHFLISYRVF